MKNLPKSEKYFPFDIQISKPMWDKMQLDLMEFGLTSRTKVPLIFFYRQVASRLNRLPERSTRPVKAGNVNLYALLTRVFRYLLNQYTRDKFPGLLENIVNNAGLDYSSGEMLNNLHFFVERFPGTSTLEKKQTAAEYFAADDRQGQREKTVTVELLLLL